MKLEVIEKDGSSDILQPDQVTIEIRADGEPIAEINVWPDQDTGKIIIDGAQYRQIQWDVPK